MEIRAAPDAADLAVAEKAAEGDVADDGLEELEIEVELGPWLTTSVRVLLVEPLFDPSPL